MKLVAEHMKLPIFDPEENSTKYSVPLFNSCSS